MRGLLGTAACVWAGIGLFALAPTQWKAAIVTVALGIAGALALANAIERVLTWREKRVSRLYAGRDGKLQLPHCSHSERNRHGVCLFCGCRCDGPGFSQDCPIQRHRQMERARAPRTEGNSYG